MVPLCLFRTIVFGAKTDKITDIKSETVFFFYFIFLTVTTYNCVASLG